MSRAKGRLEGLRVEVAKNDHTPASAVGVQVLRQPICGHTPKFGVGAPFCLSQPAFPVCDHEGSLLVGRVRTAHSRLHKHCPWPRWPSGLVDPAHIAKAIRPIREGQARAIGLGWLGPHELVAAAQSSQQAPSEILGGYFCQSENIWTGSRKEPVNTSSQSGQLCLKFRTSPWCAWRRADRKEIEQIPEGNAEYSHGTSCSGAVSQMSPSAVVHSADWSSAILPYLPWSAEETPAAT